MQAASSEHNRTDKRSQPPPAAASTSSTADGELLRALEAKLKELTESQPPAPPTGMSAGTEAAVVPASPSAATAPVREPASSRLPMAAGGAMPMVCEESTGPKSRRGAGVSAAAPALDSTQTVRALTSMELTGGEASRWFAIELMLSADQIDAAEVPNLDIFKVYRLYLVSAPDQGRLMHALRLGFFSSEVAAESVARYVGTYFRAPTIRRVSIAEHERFADEVITAGKDIGVSGGHAVIELAGTPAPRPQARKIPAPAAAPPAARRHSRSIAGLLWSRPSKVDR